MDEHPVFVYQQYFQHLICEVWCQAQDEILCTDLLSNEFEEIYWERDWVKTAVDEIYEICKKLTDEERADIKEAFFVNNNIEELCEAQKEPIGLDILPDVVEKKMKTFLIKCYSDLITAKEKLDYYNKLIEHQKANYKFCPCCGILPVESTESRYREDNDHYGPKAEYPFASVNFSNLVPLCSKCNKKCKSSKNPFENRRKSFYAFKALDQEFEIVITINNTDATNYGELSQDEISMSFNNDSHKVATWDWLFEITTRYNEEVRQFSKTELRTLANRFNRNTRRKHGATYEEILNDEIENYNIDRYDDRKFLKASFLQEMLNKPEWLAVYT
ncbi:hypothetical protein [Spirosoma panaciterrae]|uniref:hypothetical protein n=1 Tax=Spirosoma panaciterrae TaxID=496058 RepID=UPI001B7F8F32|nr:hypothetical protein [Spirosoma panaciterrae]